MNASAMNGDTFTNLISINSDRISSFQWDSLYVVGYV